MRFAPGPDPRVRFRQRHLPRRLAPRAAPAGARRRCAHRLRAGEGGLRQDPGAAARWCSPSAASPTATSAARTSPTPTRPRCIGRSANEPAILRGHRRRRRDRGRLDRPAGAQVLEYIALEPGGPADDTQGRFTDPVRAKKLGFERPIVPGALSMSVLTRLVTDLDGAPTATSSRFDINFRRPVLQEDELRSLGPGDRHRAFR